MIIKIRKTYNVETDYTVNDALESCVVMRDSNHLVNTMELVYRRDGKYADQFVIGALLWGLYRDSGSTHTDTYIITYIKITQNEIRATAEETCRYIFRRCVVYPVSSSGRLSDVIDAIFYQASPRPDYTDRYYYQLTTGYSMSIPSCSVNFKTPITLLDALKGSEGSIADETHLQIRLSSRLFKTYLKITLNFSNYSNSISDSVVTGREIAESSFERDLQYWMNSYVPFWKGNVNDTETVVTDGNGYVGGTKYLCQATDVIDCSSKFATQPTTQQLSSAGQKYANERRAQFTDGNYYVKIQDGMTIRQLSQNGETSILRSINANIGNLISITLLNGEKITARVTATEYDMLREVYTKIDLGEKIDSFSRMLAKDIKR